MQPAGESARGRRDGGPVTETHWPRQSRQCLGSICPRLGGSKEGTGGGGRPRGVEVRSLSLRGFGEESWGELLGEERRPW